MRLTTIFLCLVFLLAVPAMLLADREDRREGTTLVFRDRDSRRDNDRFENRQAGVTFTGTIKKIDKRGDWIEISSGRRTEKVSLTRDTNIYTDRDRSTSLRSLKKGEKVYIVGYETRRGQIIATRIHIGGEPRGHRFERTIEVKVVRDSALLGRKLKVEPVSRHWGMPDKFSLEIERRAQISTRGRELSVQDIRVGDILQVEGRWEGTTFIAERIRVEENHGQTKCDHCDK